MIERTEYGVLLRERRRLLKQMAAWPPVLRGSLREHMGRCGNLKCRCHDKKKPVLHGPYRYLSHRYNNRTQTILLTKSKLQHAQDWVANYKRLIQVIYDLCEVNFRLLRYHHDKLPCLTRGKGRSS
jgi:hypothetical protein